MEFNLQRELGIRTKTSPRLFEERIPCSVRKNWEIKGKREFRKELRHGK